MSKKTGKKPKVVVPEIDPNSPEWAEEVARKQSEAYEMVQRAMTRSQIELVLETREDLLRQQSELETEVKQQSQDQNDVYQYLRNKLKNNYVAIAELETKVSEAHEERLMREKQLLATIKSLGEERENEKRRLEERLATLDVELTAIKEYQENSEIYEQTLKEMAARIERCKEAYSKEVAKLKSQLEEEWEAGRRDKEERRKITKKAAAKATQEQLGPRTKHRIVQNKKMMSELRFQCVEVEKMQRIRNGLMESNTLLLARSASSRHRVEELARRSHLLQKITFYMYQKLQARCSSQRETGGTSGSGEGSCSGQDANKRFEQREQSAATGASTGGAGRGGRAGESGKLYKLAGMSKEERQQMLDLREELRREEVGIAADQVVVKEKREELLKAEIERSRALALKTDLARILASCHEDPMLGVDGGNPPTSDCGYIRTRQAEHPNTEPVSAGTMLLPAIDATRSSQHSQVREFKRVGQDGQPRQERNQQREKHLQRQPQQPQEQCQHRQGQGSPASEGFHSAVSTAGKEHESEEPTSSILCAREEHKSSTSRGLVLWPENIIVPTETGVQMTGERIEDGAGWWMGTTSRCMDADVLKAVVRLFLSKLQVSVEAITPRLPAPDDGWGKFPDIPSGVSKDGGGRCAFGFDFGCRRRKLRLSRRGARNAGDHQRPKQRAPNSKSVGGGTNGNHDGHRDHSEGCRTPSARLSDDVDGGGGRSSSSPLIGGHRESEEDYRASRGIVTSKRGGQDDATTWSEWHTTGIPSWDILEPAVRQTKRRRTRDAACQTLTYRQLRDNDDTTLSTQPKSMSGKHRNQNPNPPSGPAHPHVVRPRHRHQVSQCHVMPAPRFGPMFAPPASPLSSATTKSTPSVYRVTDRGGVVHGAIVRGGHEGGRKRLPGQRQERKAGKGHEKGGDLDAGVFPFRWVHAGEQPVEDTTTPKKQGEKDRGINNEGPENHDGASSLLASPENGEGQPICSPPSSQQCTSTQEQAQNRETPEQKKNDPSRHRRPESTGNQRLSPPLGKVAVSWGQEFRGDDTAEGGGVGHFSAVEVPVTTPSNSRSKRGLRTPQDELDVWSAEYQDRAEDLEKSGGRRSAGVSMSYEPLSEGPDYRKILLFTVDDGDCRIWRRPQLPESPETNTVIPPKMTGVIARAAQLQKSGARTRPRDGNIPKTADEERGDTQASCAWQRPGSVAAGANFVRSKPSSMTTVGRTKSPKAAAAAAAARVASSFGHDLFVGKRSKNQNSISQGRAGGMLPEGAENNIVWDQNSCEVEVDGPPTLCSSISNLSGGPF